MALTSSREDALVAGWRGKVAEVLARDGLTLQVESRESLAGESDPITALTSLETLAHESFVEDDFEGRLHALTLRRESDNAICAIIYWRDLPRQEMLEWVRHVAVLQGPSPSALHPDESAADEGGAEEMMPMIIAGGAVGFTDNAALPSSWTAEHETGLSDSPAPSDPFARWTKIEVMGTAKGAGGRGYGTTLLASALFLAAVRDGARHVVLQVAGGAANVPASRLYAKFGFVPAPPGVFDIPNQDLLVLWDLYAGLASAFGVSPAHSPAALPGSGPAALPGSGPPS